MHHIGKQVLLLDVFKQWIEMIKPRMLWCLTGGFNSALSRLCACIQCAKLRPHSAGAMDVIKEERSSMQRVSSRRMM